jgi:hypothetical protein
MRRPVVQWTLAILITLLSAVFQRVTGPTYPVRGHAQLGGQDISLRLTRTHGGPGDQPVAVSAPDAAMRGDVLWRRYPSNDSWQVLEMTRAGDVLQAALPHQPPAGKLEYQVRLMRGEERVAFPSTPAITRFKGDVSPWILAPHVLCMFFSMLLSTRAVLAAAFGAEARTWAWWAVGFLVVGGFVLGPAVQEQAFGEWWSGVPYGWDLTDNKTLLALIAWLPASVSMWRGRPSRGAIMFAGVAMMIVFAIPHSVWGSEINWAKQG